MKGFDEEFLEGAREEGREGGIDGNWSGREGVGLGRNGFWILGLGMEMEREMEMEMMVG